MDIVLCFVVCYVARIMLFILEYQRKKKKKKSEPILALLFGGVYYWIKANPTANTN